MPARKNQLIPLTAVSAALGVIAAPPTGAQISDAAGFLVQRDTDDLDPGGTNTNLFPNSTLTVNGTPLVGTTGSVPVPGLGTTLTIDERDYDNDPATPGFGANRTNAWLADANGDRVGLLRSQGFEIGVTVNLDAFFTQLVTARNTRKEAGFRFKNPGNPAGNSLFIVTTDDDLGEVVALGSGGIFIPLQNFQTLDAVNGSYVPGTDARLTFKYTPPGANIFNDPALYDFTYDAGNDGVDVLSITGIVPNNFGGPLDGTEIALMMQGAIADGNPDGDAATFADEFVTAVFSDLTLTFDPLPGITGDYNDSGLVEQGDLNQVLNNWGAAFDSIAATWVNQRPTEGIVDQAELNVVLNNWGSDSAPDFSGSAVPEPAALLALLPAALACRRRSA